MTQYDITIVGGGSVGVTLACALARIAQLKILLVEAAPMKGFCTAVGVDVVARKHEYRRYFDAVSTALSRGTAEIFHQLNLWSEIRQYATPLQQIHISEKDRFGQSVIDAKQEKVPALGYVVENHWLTSVLLAQLQKTSVECRSPVSITAVKPINEGWEVVLSNTAQQTKDVVSTKLLVGSDGSHSSVRKLLGIEASHEDYQQTAVVTNVVTEKQGLMAFERFMPTGPLALLPLIEKRYALVWSLPPDQAKAMIELSPQDFLVHVQKNFGHRLGAFTQVGERNLYPLQLIQAKEMVRPHCVLLGNAARTLHPVAGQGFNLAVRDIAALTALIQRQYQRQQPLGDLQSLLNFSEQRQKDQTKVVQFTDTLLRTFSRPSEGWLGLRNLGLVTFDLWPSAKHLLSVHAMGKGAYVKLGDKPDETI